MLQDEGSAYGLTFPDMPEAFTASDDWPGISAAATEALDLWFKDQPDVEPATLAAIRVRRCCASAGRRHRLDASSFYPGG